MQQISQDILKVMNLVTSTKKLIQGLRDNGWDILLNKVISFCQKNEVEIPDMNIAFNEGRGRARHRQEQVTMEHHYKVDIFIAAIDSQMQELNSRFSEQTVELLVLSSSLDLANGFKSFNIDNICKLAEKFYPQDFTEQEKIQLRFQLQHYKHDVLSRPDFQNLPTVSDLLQSMVNSGKSNVYYLVDILTRLVLTLLISTATTERAFSAMKIVKTKLRNKMEDDFLADYLVVYIEKEIAEYFNTDKIIDDFYSLKERRAQLA